jgi:hypothetical protein
MPDSSEPEPSGKKEKTVIKAVIKATPGNQA